VPTPHVTDAESAVLEALWRLGPLTPARLIAEVKAGRPWGETTIKTLLARLRRKKAVRSHKEDGVLRYHPTLTRTAYVEDEVSRLVRRLFGGDPAALVAFLKQAAAPQLRR
jgi:predicted transcriptional regulator